jgi:hypothetical protein
LTSDLDAHSRIDVHFDVSEPLTHRPGKYLSYFKLPRKSSGVLIANQIPILPLLKMVMEKMYGWSGDESSEFIFVIAGYRGILFGFYELQDLKSRNKI